MAPPTRLTIARPDIEAYLDGLSTRVFTKRQLADILNRERSSWRLAQRTTADQFISYLASKSRLSVHHLNAPAYQRELTRFAWGAVSPYPIALTVGSSSAYLSHASAIFVHGLTDVIPRQIFVNAEQSAKPIPKSILTQAGLDRAFRSAQRSSNLIYELDGGPTVVVISGKATHSLEVEVAQDPTGAPVRTTSIERTRIDAVVRPSYAGGLGNILDAYRAARDRVSVNRMRATLVALNYMYPYHQAIGFLMQLAGYPAGRTELFRSLGLNYDFYLAHKIANPRYVPEWRLYVPDDIA